MCILITMVLFSTSWKGEIEGNKLNNRSYVTIWFDLPHHGLLVWLVLESNHFCCLILRYPIFSEQCILRLWWQREWFSHSTVSILVSNIPCWSRWHITNVIYFFTGRDITTPTISKGKLLPQGELLVIPPKGGFICLLENPREIFSNASKCQ